MVVPDNPEYDADTFEDIEMDSSFVNKIDKLKLNNVFCLQQVIHLIQHRN